MDSDDQLRLIKRIYQALNLDENKWPHKQAQWYINGQKDEGLRPQHIQDSGDPFVRTMLQIYRAYEEDCQRGGMVDFAEILLRAHELWLHKPHILEHYQQRFPFVLVDEFQDTNAIQYRWLRLLAGPAGTPFVVGDDGSIRRISVGDFLAKGTAVAPGSSTPLQLSVGSAYDVVPEVAVDLTLADGDLHDLAVPTPGDAPGRPPHL